MKPLISRFSAQLINYLTRPTAFLLWTSDSLGISREVHLKTKGMLTHTCILSIPWFYWSDYSCNQVISRALFLCLLPEDTKNGGKQLLSNLLRCNFRATKMACYLWQMSRELWVTFLWGTCSHTWVFLSFCDSSSLRSPHTCSNQCHAFCSVPLFLLTHVSTLIFKYSKISHLAL